MQDPQLNLLKQINKHFKGFDSDNFVAYSYKMILFSGLLPQYEKSNIFLNTQLVYYMC